MAYDYPHVEKRRPHYAQGNTRTLPPAPLPFTALRFAARCVGRGDGGARRAASSAEASGRARQAAYGDAPGLMGNCKPPDLGGTPQNPEEPIVFMNHPRELLGLS